MRRSSLFLAVMAVALLLSVGLFWPMAHAAPGAAPLAGPTPVSAAPSGNVPTYVDFFISRAVTADTTSACADVAGYTKADIYYSVTVNANNINTNTLQLKHGNNVGALVNGIALASGVTNTNVVDMAQVNVYGRLLCVEIDATTGATGTITATVNALLK